jgi:pimeloyl-ACP methyl ester carboxylesterase
MSEKLEMRIYSDATLPTLIYLPGLHGDWTLIGGFRQRLSGLVRFVEVTYPRTLTWTLDDYEEGVERALAERGIKRGWLLGESFSSQVVWAIVARKQFQLEGVILAGGFARHPLRWGVRIAEGVCGRISLRLMTWILFGYAKFARFRFRNSPETQANIDEFIARRTELDRRAAKHRLRLVGLNDPRECAKHLTVPLYAITGFFDPIVPWFWVRPWLRKNCPSLREYKIVYTADHNVLGTAPDRSVETVVRWMEEKS